MKRAFFSLLLAACSSSPSQPGTPSTAAPSASHAPSQNEQLYAKGSAFEKEGRWEEAANTYQKYVLAMGDGLSYMDRSSMELRIKQLREKVWPKLGGARTTIELKSIDPPPTNPCAKPWDEARYEEAIACWRADYVKIQNPVDLLYASRAYELNAMLMPAISLLERFLEAADSGENAALTMRLKVMREKSAERSTSSAP